MYDVFDNKKCINILGDFLFLTILKIEVKDDFKKTKRHIKNLNTLSSNQITADYFKQLLGCK